MLLARFVCLTSFFFLGVSSSFAGTTPAATPAFSVGGGTYQTFKSVTITDSTAGASIYYTVTGVAPTTLSTKYTGPINVNRNMTLRAIAAVSGSPVSEIETATYSFVAAAEPTMNVAGGTYSSPQKVTISDSTAAASIFYTTTGVAPTSLSTKYTGPVTVGSNMTLRAVAVVVGGPASPIMSASYTILPASAPTLSLGGGTYQAYKSVTMSDATPGAAIYYTVTGVTPTTSSTRYTDPVTVNRNLTLKAIAAVPGGPVSPITSATYAFVAAAAPSFSKATGTYQGQQSVTISDATAGASIYYTTTGVAPTAQSSRYAGPLTVKSNMTLRAVAVVQGGPVSPISTVSYIIVPQSSPVATPNSSPTFFGISVDHLTSGTAWPDLPIGTIRLWDSGTKWANLNPAQGTYQWQNLDKQISLARAHNSALLYTFGGTPSWALPSKMTIKSITRSNGIVTVTTSTPHGMYYNPAQPLTRQSEFTISGVSSGGFNGSFYLTGTPGAYTLTYAQSGADSTSSAGTLSTVCGGAFAPAACAEAPGSLSQWDEYVSQLIAHIGPGAIQYWEFWDEANDPIYWQGDPKTLVAMAADARTIIRNVDPGAIFLSPSVTGTYDTEDECLGSVEYCGTTWLINWLALGGKSYVDAIAFHGYPNIGMAPEQIQGDVYQVKAAMSQNGVGSLPIWDTESSWASNANLSSQADRAAWLARHFLLEESIGVQRTFWYAYDTPTWGTLWTSASGMNTAGYAYQEVSTWLTGTALSHPCAELTTDATTFVCGYTRPNGYTAEAVWNTAGSKSYSVSSTYVQYRDLSGTVRPITGGSVGISTAPILLESSTAP